MPNVNHLAAINRGLKTVTVDRRRHRDRGARLLAITRGIDCDCRDKAEGA